MLTPTELALANLGYYVGIAPKEMRGDFVVATERVIAHDEATANALVAQHYAAMEAHEAAADEIIDMINRDGGPDAWAANVRAAGIVEPDNIVNLHGWKKTEAEVKGIGSLRAAYFAVKNNPPETYSVREYAGYMIAVCGLNDAIETCTVRQLWMTDNVWNFRQQVGEVIAAAMQDAT